MRRHTRSRPMHRVLILLALALFVLPAAAAGQEEPQAPAGDAPAQEGEPTPDSEPAQPPQDEAEPPASEPDPAPTDEQEPDSPPAEEEKPEPEPAPTEEQESEQPAAEEQEPAGCVSQGTESLETDQSEYAPGSTAHIKGAGFAASCETKVEVSRTEGGWAPFVVEVETSSEGKLDADYLVDGDAGEYQVHVFGVDDAVLASTTFTVTAEEPTPDECVAQGTEQVATDKSRYAPRSTVHITGDGYSASCDLRVEVTRPNGRVDTAEVQVAPAVEEQNAEVSARAVVEDDSAATGSFQHDYALGNLTGRYRVRVLSAVGEAFASMPFAVEGPRPTSCERRGRETIATDKADYRPGATVHMTGSGYARSCLVKVKVVRPDGSVVRGDASFEPGLDQVRTTARGRLFYDYKLNGIEGLYRVRVLGAGNVLLAKTTFTDQIRATPSDPRAEFSPGNVTTCGQVGFPGDVQIGAHDSDDAADPFVEGTTTGINPDRLQVVITPAGVAAGVVVNAVVVKGSNGYNLYTAPFVPPDEAPPQNYISPKNDGGNVANISHWFVCYTFGGVEPDQGELIVLKRVIPPRGPTVEPLPSEFTVDVTCILPDPPGGTIEETFTFGEGGGVGTTLGGTRARIGIPVGSTCTVEEQDTGTFPDGSDVVYIPGQTVTIGEGVGVVVVVVNNFRDVETLTGSLQITKVVEPPSADLPSSFRVHVACTDRTSTTLTVPAGGSATVEGITADAYCAVEERMGSLPSDVEVTYSGDGVVVARGHGIVQIVENETVEVTITNDAGDVPPGPPEPPRPGGGGDGAGGGGAAQPRGDLPLTGGPAMLVGAIGLVLVGGGLVLARRRND
jgi:LPXTG-motif cell wall-anchored protein